MFLLSLHNIETNLGFMFFSNGIEYLKIKQNLILWISSLKVTEAGFLELWQRILLEVSSSANKVILVNIFLPLIWFRQHLRKLLGLTFKPKENISLAIAPLGLICANFWHLFILHKTLEKLVRVEIVEFALNTLVQFLIILFMDIKLVSSILKHVDITNVRS